MAIRCGQHSQLADKERHGADIRETFLRTRDIAETAGQLGLGAPVVERALGEMVPDFDDLVAAQREAAGAVSGILSTNSYDVFVEKHPVLPDGRPRPGKQVMMLRFGLWRGALDRAGLPANPHSGPRKEFSEADAVAAVVECGRQTGSPPTAHGYDRWQRDQAARPSGSTVRKLTSGAWNPLLLRAWQLVHGIILDQDDEDASVPEPLLPDDGTRPYPMPFVPYHPADEGVLVSLRSDLVHAARR